MTKHLCLALAAVVPLVSGVFVTVAAQSRAFQPGDPLQGLTPKEFTEFRLGLDDFSEVETSEDGLGPAFNGTSCAVCHNVPSIGGSSSILEVRAASTDEHGEFRSLDASGETLMHLFSTPSHSCQALIPDTATVISRRASIPLFGAGLVEAISDDTLLALDDATDRNRDGISGRAAIIIDPATGLSRVGRFGWKAQHATLLAFAGDAYRNEMGITNDLFPQEAAYDVSAEAMRRCDPRPDPEDIRDPMTGRRGIDNFEAFMKFLAPLPRGPIDAAVREGELVFSALGCAQCHVPVLTTGRNTHPLFDRRPIALYSDLLLHDVGTGDGIRQGSAATSEIRTPALWGLHLRRPFLHDGSAATASEAIRRHGAEGALAARGFDLLSVEDVSKLLAFLRSL